MKVMFVHAVCAKSGPTIALPRRRASASPPTTPKLGCAIWGLHPFAHESHHADELAALFALHPSDKPITTTAASAAVFAKVNVFCTSLPISRPRVLVKASIAIKAIALSA